MRTIPLDDAPLCRATSYLGLGSCAAANCVCELVTGSSFDSVWASVAHIEGWLAREQAYVLYEAARSIPEGSGIVEIGSHHGKSTVVLARAKPSSARLLAVDPFTSPRWGGGQVAYETFLGNLERFGVAEAVEVCRGTSREARQLSTRPVGLLYVDGAHDRRSVLTDIDMWEPLVAQRGLVAFHDAFSSIGVTQALLQRHIIDPRFRYIGSRGSLALFRRQDLPPLGRIANAARLAGRLGYFARNAAIKVSMQRGWRRVPPWLGHREAGHPY